MHEHDTGHDQHKRQNIAMWVFLAIILYFLVTEHWAHVVPFLPWLLLLACPLMHVFMHGGHGGHGEQDKDNGSHEHSSHCGHGGHSERDEQDKGEK